MAFGNYEFPHSHNYDSDLRELINLVKQYRDDYGKILSTIDEIVTEFSEIKREFDELNTKVDEMFTYIDDEIKAAINKYRQEVDSKIKEIQLEIDSIFSMVESILPSAKAYADMKDEQVKSILRTEMMLLLDILSKRIADIEQEITDLHLTTNNPLTGYESSLEEVVSIIRDRYRVHALTNDEYSDLGLTDTEYYNFYLNNAQYILEGKPLLRKKWMKYLNPVTGMKTRIANVNSYIATMCQNTITASNYAAQDLTNTEYAALNLTNIEYFLTTPSDLPW